MQPTILRATILYHDGQYQYVEKREQYNSEKTVDEYIDYFEKMLYTETNASVVIVTVLECTLHDDDGNYVLTEDGDCVFDEIYIV